MASRLLAVHPAAATAALAGLLLAFSTAARVPVTHDWTDKHAIYSNPDLPEEARAKGAYAEWEQNYRDPRFVKALLRKLEWREAQANGSDPKAAKARAKAALAGMSPKADASVEAIIRHYYLTILRRAADAGGLAYHLGEVDRLEGSGVDAREVLRVISKVFFFSAEYLALNRTNDAFVEDLYQTYFQRAADGDGLSYWLGQLATGASREAVLESFLFSDEFQAFMDNALGNSTQRPETALVIDAYRSAFGRLPDQAGFDHWREQLRLGQCEDNVTLRAGELTATFFQSQEYVARNRTSAQYVADLYDAIFRRSPDAGGLAHWVAQLDSSAITRAQLLEAFFASEEWTRRLGELGQAGCMLAHRDWSFILGNTGGGSGQFPAKYNFDITSTPSCANDFVVFPATGAGATGSGNFATRNGTVTGSVGTGNTITITNGAGTGRTLVLTSTAATNSGIQFANGGVGATATTATNIANAINRNGASVGVRATVAGSTVTVTSLTQGAASNSITLAENLAAFTWAAGTLGGGSGTAGQPTIFAVNNLYSSCGSASTAYPQVMWSYNTGTGQVVDGSPLISLDGTQVVFLQRSGTVASLGILKWSAASPGGVGTPTVPTAVTPAAFRACTAPCFTQITFNGSPNSTSTPYYDYINDVLFVGDDVGRLHKFTGVFLGTPAESGAPWPVTVSAGFILNGPVYDRSTNKVYTGTNREPTTSVGGRLHAVDATTGAVETSIVLGGNIAATNSGSKGVSSPVIVDQTAQRVYAFVGSDTSADCGGVECHAVFQFNTTQTLGSQATPPRATLGRGQIFTRFTRAGIFDNAYYTSPGANPTGFLYACGSNGGTFATSRHPNLWRVAITNNVMSTTSEIGPSLVSADTSDTSGGGGECSYLSDVVNNGQNYFFTSVPGQGNQTGCTGACIYLYNITGVTAGTWTNLPASAGLQVQNGTSGIIIDNTSSATGASQIYFMWLQTPGNAIQASQSALQ